MAGDDLETAARYANVAAALSTTRLRRRDAYSAGGRSPDRAGARLKRGARRAHEAAEHRHLLGDPAAAVVGIASADRRRRSGGACRRRSPCRTACPRSGTPARNCGRGCGARRGPPAHGAAGGSAAPRAAARPPGRSSCRHWRATSSRSGARSSGSGCSRRAGRRRTGQTPPAPGSSAGRRRRDCGRRSTPSPGAGCGAGCAAPTTS